MINASVLRTKLAHVALVIAALFLVFGVIFSHAQSTSTIGTLSFSPSTVKAGEVFTTSLVGGPANTNTVIWQDDNDGKGYINYGSWKKTDANGGISSQATMNCQGLGGKLLNQKVYLEYVGGGVSSIATIIKDCRASTLPPQGGTVGTLSFSPGTVKDAQAFSISLIGGPSNTDTILWIDNGDGKGFRNFGGWIRTDQSGSIQANRVMDCKNYTTIEPGQLLPVGDRVLTQKVYIEYAGQGGVSATATHTKDCRASVTTPPVSGGTLSFVKTLLNIPREYQGGNQLINEVVFFDERFVFGGDCGVNMAGTGPGGGLWIATEDGSSVIEREACLDAGSVTNVLYQHGNVHSKALHIDWSGKGIVRENSSWASCLGTTRSDGSCSGGFGPGANRAVYYGPSGNNSVSPISTSLLHLYNNQLVVLKNRAIYTGATKSSADLISLPDFKLLSSIPYDNQKSYFQGFGDYAVTSYGDLYSISEGGSVQLVKKLATNYSVSSGNFLPLAFAFDNSTWPAKLAILEAPKPTYTFNPGNGQYTANNGDKRKIYVYKLSGTEVVLDKTINVPADLPAVNYIWGTKNFGIWGDYLVVPISPEAYKATYEESVANVGLELWKDGKKVDSIKYPFGNSTMGLTISKNGYVSVLALNGFTGKTTATLFKIGAPKAVTPPIIPPLPPGGGATTSTPPSTPPFDFDDLVRQIQDLLDQIDRLRELLGRATGGGGAADNRPLAPDTQ